MQIAVRNYSYPKLTETISSEILTGSKFMP